MNWAHRRHCVTALASEFTDLAHTTITDFNDLVNNLPSPFSGKILLRFKILVNRYDPSGSWPNFFWAPLYCVWYPIHDSLPQGGHKKRLEFKPGGLNHSSTLLPWVFSSKIQQFSLKRVHVFLQLGFFPARIFYVFLRISFLTYHGLIYLFHSN